MEQGLAKEERDRIWAHEDRRLFCDRLVADSDRDWCHETIDQTARQLFAGIDLHLLVQWFSQRG
jgi:hypothetical protein